jgi:hypothetical protein
MASLMGMIWVVAIGFAGVAGVMMFILWRRNQYINSGQEEGE